MQKEVSAEAQGQSNQGPLKLSLDTIFSPELIANPYPGYDLLRSQAPVFNVPDTHIWLLSRYADIQMILRDKRLGHPPDPSLDQEAERQRRKDNIAARMLSEMMLVSDPPDHTRLRSLVVKAFNAKRVEAMRERIRLQANKLIDAMVQGRSSGDLVNLFNHALPVLVICEILGIPKSDWDMFMDTSQVNGRILDPTPMSAEEQAHSNQSSQKSLDYFQALFAERKRHPQDDLLTELVVSETEFGKLSGTELVANVVLLFGAGHETTVNLLGNALLALDQYPDQRQQLQAHPELMPAAVEEFLRYDSSVQITGRGTFEAIELDGHLIPKGDQVLTLLGAGHRDPAQFENPNQLDITRKDVKLLAFGGGIHYCLGAQLARIEAVEALNVLFERLPRLRLVETEPPIWKETITLRGVKTLPVRWD